MKPNFDVLAHHAINTSGPPAQSAFDPADITTADMGVLRKALRRAESAGNTGTNGRHPLWVTEFWWSSKPPGGVNPKRPKVHARYIAETLYRFWKAGVSLAINLRIRDASPKDSELPGTGIYYRDGSPKPAAKAFRFPFVADPGKRGDTKLWGLAPRAGRVTIESKRRSSGWRVVTKLKAGANRVFFARARTGSASQLRARSSGQTSLPWKLR